MALILISLLINIVSAPIVFWLGRGYQRKISPSISRRLNVLRSLLPFELQHEPLVITYGYVMPRNKGDLFSVEQGDLIALLKAYQLVTTFCGSQQIQILDSFSLRSSIDLHKNIFTLSGPKWNPVTDYYLGRLGSPAQFSSNPRGIRVQTPAMNSPVFYRTEREDGKMASDCYGLILSGSIQEDGRWHNVLICAGRTTLSTNACLLYLNTLACSSASLKELKHHGISSEKKWGVLLKVRNNRPQSNMIEGPLHEGDVDVSVVQTFLPDDFHSPYVHDYQRAQIQEKGDLKKI